jgi:hypothetical protein
MSSELNESGLPTSNGKTTDQTALSSRAKQELEKLRTPPSLPGWRFWLFVVTVFAAIIGLNTEPGIRVVEAVIVLVGLSNVVLVISAATILAVVRFIVFERLRRGNFGSKRMLWTIFAISRAGGTSLNKPIHHEGVTELAMLTGTKDESRRRLRNQIVIAAAIAALYASLLVTAVSAHLLVHFRPLLLIAILTVAFIYIAVWIYYEVQRNRHGPMEEDIKGIVTLHCECEEERRKELKELHKRGN